MFIPSYGIFFLIRFLAMITKYTVLDEQRREIKRGKSQRQSPRSITRGAKMIHDKHNFLFIESHLCGIVNSHHTPMIIDKYYLMFTILRLSETDYTIVQ